MPALSSTTATPALQGDALVKAQARRRELYKKLLQNPANLDVAFEYAGLSAQVGDIEAAIATLQLMLIYAPGLPRLQLELGVLYFRLNAYDEARYYFKSALAAPNVPDVVKARVDPYLKAIQNRTAGYTISGTVLFGGRYQTNANAGPHGTVDIQGIPFQVDESASGTPDYNSFVTSSTTYSLDLKNQGDRFNINLATYYANYSKRVELNTDFVELKAGPLFDLERFNIKNTSLGIYGISNGVLLGDKPYQLTFGAGSNVTTLITPTTQFGVRGEFRREKYYNSNQRPTAADRTGELVTGQAYIQQQLNPRFAIFASFETQRRASRADYLDTWEWTGSAGWTLAMQSPNKKQPDPWVVAMQGGYVKRDYDAPDPTIDPTASERDDEFFISGSFTLPMRDGWALLAQAGYRDVRSNYDLRVYQNRHGSLALQKRF